MGALTAAVFDILGRTVRASLSASLDLRQTGGRAVAVAAPLAASVGGGEQPTEHDLPLPAVGFQYGLGRCRPRTLLDTWSCDQWKTTGAAAPLSAQFPARGLRPQNVPPRVVVADRARTVGGDRSGSRRCPLVERSTPYGLVQAVRLARACGQTPAAAAPPLVTQSRGRQPRRPTITTLILLKSDVVTRESVWGRAQRRQHGGNKYRGIPGF